MAPTQVRDTPVLVTAVDLPEEVPLNEGVRIEVRLQPFNAGRLLEAVAHILRRP